MRVINIVSVVCSVYFQIRNVMNIKNCSSVNGTNTCCSGFTWSNERNNCIPCEKGKHGFHCEKSCLFPYYGTDCQSQCNCAKTDCHYADGCRQTSKIGQISSHTTLTYVKNAAKENVEKKNNKANPYCQSILKTPPKERTPMIVGIIVLAAVAFIISLTILFTYQIEKRQRSRNCREGNVQAEDLNNVYHDTFFELSISRTISAKSVIDKKICPFHFN